MHAETLSENVLRIAILKQKGRWKGQAEEGVGYSAASTEVSANFTESSKVGRAFHLPTVGGREPGIYISPPEFSHWMWAVLQRPCDLRRDSSLQLMQSSKGTKN